MSLFQAHAAGPGGFDIMSMAPIALIFVVFYFLIFRPQQKKAKQHEELVNSLRRGDRVVTASGIIGHVDKVLDDKEIMLEIADGVKVRYLRRMIHGVENGERKAAAAPTPLKLASSKDGQDKASAKKNAKSAVKKIADKEAE